MTLSPSCSYYIRRILKKTVDQPNTSDLLPSIKNGNRDIEDRLNFLYSNSYDKVILHLEKLVYSHQHARSCGDQIASQDITGRLLWWLGYGVTAHPIGARVFVVDDTIETLKLITTLLTQAGYETYSALNGTLALTRIASLNPDLIILDINLPDIDGYQVYKKLQAGSTTASIPVIFLSGMDSSIHNPSKSQVGYLTKPFKPQNLLDHVNRHLKLCLSSKPLTEDVLTTELKSRQQYAQESLWEHISQNAEQRDSNAGSDYFFRATLDGRYLRVSQSFAQLHGYDSAETMISSVTNLWQQIYPHTGHQEQWIACCQCPNQIKRFITKIKTKNNQILNVVEEISLIQDRYARNLFYQGYIRLI